MTINHIHVFVEFVGSVCKGLFVPAQTHDIALRNGGPHHRLHPPVCRLVKGEVKVSDFQLLTFENAFFMKTSKLTRQLALSANAKDICVPEAKAQAAYAVAKDVCVKETKGVEVKALADAKLGKKIGEARKEASDGKTVIALAESIGLTVIAEGVETSDQRDFLASQGCHAYQGIRSSRPFPLDEFETCAERSG